jgi:hypothetical protein
MGSYWFSSIGFKDRQHNIYTHAHDIVLLSRGRYILIESQRVGLTFQLTFSYFFFFLWLCVFYHFLFFLFLFVFSFCSRWTSGCNATWSWRHITHATRRPISTLRATCNPIAFVASIPVVESTIAVVSPWDFVYFWIFLIFFFGKSIW